MSGPISVHTAVRCLHDGSRKENGVIKKQIEEMTFPIVKKPFEISHMREIVNGVDAMRPSSRCYDVTSNYRSKEEYLCRIK